MGCFCTDSLWAPRRQQVEVQILGISVALVITQAIEISIDSDPDTVVSSSLGPNVIVALVDIANCPDQDDARGGMDSKYQQVSRDKVIRLTPKTKEEALALKNIYHQLQ
ncbi:hypothetical protein STEG23_014063, partial [Scotinomys teguina]